MSVCMRHNLNGLKLVHENKYIIISDNLQRKTIYEPNRNYVFQSVCLSMLYVRSISPKRLEAYHRNVQSSHFSGWLLILVLTALLVGITVYIEPPPRER